MSWGLTPIHQVFRPGWRSFLAGAPLPCFPDRNPQVRLIEAAVINEVQLVRQPYALAQIHQGSWNARLYLGAGTPWPPDFTRDATRALFSEVSSRWK